MFGQLLTVAVTISVALYLNLVFQRRASTDAVRKAILIQLAKDVQTSLTDTYHASLVCHPTKKLTKDVADAITKKERCLSVNLSLLEEGLKHCYAFTLPELLEMKKIRLHLKKLLTDSPFPVGPINQDRQDRIQKTVKIMGSQCVKLIFSISSIDKPRL